MLKTPQRPVNSVVEGWWMMMLSYWAFWRVLV